MVWYLSELLLVLILLNNELYPAVSPSTWWPFLQFDMQSLNKYDNIIFALFVIFTSNEVISKSYQPKTLPLECIKIRLTSPKLIPWPTFNAREEYIIIEQKSTYKMVYYICAHIIPKT